MLVIHQLLTYRVKSIITTILSINSIFLSSYVDAQIIPDGTFNTQINLIDAQQKITGGIESGTNLFHSFKEFSPRTDFVTHFENNSQIRNIFTRVTGGSSSLIDGLIRANANASLFILNPAGIIFGENAQLDIGGSFISTTAESIIFADGTKFDTQTNHNSLSLLKVNIPIGLQFGNSPKAISSINSNPENQVYLEVSPGNTIAFVGGNIELQNIAIRAFSGNVEIIGVAESEMISLDLNNNRWELSYEHNIKLNNIEFSQDSQINTSGKEGSINLSGQGIFLNDVNIINSTNTDTDGGSINLFATKNINFKNAILSTQVERFDENRIPLQNPVTGKGGDIIISAQDIIIGDGSAISASTINQGAGGNITIEASRSLELSGFDGEFPPLIVTSVGDSFPGGNIEIHTGKLVITDGARIDSSTFDNGNAGNIIINANESILISGDSFNEILNREFNSGLLASSGIENLPLELQNSNLGVSGSLTVNTPRLFIEDGGQISVSNFGTGNAGNIEINAEELLLNNDSQIISTRASGDEGSIIINGNELILRDNSSIATTASGIGTGGNITLNTDNIVLFDDSTINANANLGSGGEITITTQGLFTQNNPVDAITASSQVEGLEGIVTINTPDIGSKFEATEQRQSPLAAEESIYAGCSLGTDFSANKFSYIGRGGMRKGPFDSLESQEVIADLGLEDSVIQSVEIAPNHNSKHHNIEKPSSSITEATAWIINSQGKVELIAQAPNNPLPSGCLFK